VKLTNKTPVRRAVLTSSFDFPNPIDNELSCWANTTDKEAPPSGCQSLFLHTHAARFYKLPQRRHYRVRISGTGCRIRSSGTLYGTAGNSTYHDVSKKTQRLRQESPGFLGDTNLWRWRLQLRSKRRVMLYYRLHSRTFQKTGEFSKSSMWEPQRLNRTVSLVSWQFLAPNLE
jgi:hypothetical protein